MYRRVASLWSKAPDLEQGLSDLFHSPRSVTSLMKVIAGTPGERPDKIKDLFRLFGIQIIQRL